MNDPSSAFRALLLTDDKPGHYNLSEGILAAIARRRPVAVARLAIRRRRWVPGRVLAFATRGGVSPARLLALGYGIDAATLPPADLVVSAGGDTLAANIAAARLRGVPNIFYGSLRRFAPEDFALVLTSYPANAGRPRHAMTLKPSRYDPGAVGLARAIGESREPWGLPHRPPRVALLIGGSSGEATWADRDWDDLAGLVTAAHALHGTRWLVSNSRRTPDAVGDRLAGMSAEDGPIAAFVDVRRAGAGTLAEMLAAADAVAVTADSSSMLSEAIWACKPTVALAPRALRLTANETAYRAYLEDQGWCANLALAGTGPETLVGAFERVMPLRDNPLDLLATLIAARLPGLLP